MFEGSHKTFLFFFQRPLFINERMNFKILAGSYRGDNGAISKRCFLMRSIRELFLWHPPRLCLGFSAELEDGSRHKFATSSGFHSVILLPAREPSLVGQKRVS